MKENPIVAEVRRIRQEQYIRLPSCRLADQKTAFLKFPCWLSG